MSYPFAGSYTTEVWLYKVLVLGQSSGTVSTGGQASLSVSGAASASLSTSFSHKEGVVTVRRPGASLGEEWSIAL